MSISRMTSRMTTGVIALFFLSFYLPVTAMAEAGISNTEIVLGISNAQSGPVKLLGSEYLRGFQSYFKKINEEGGEDTVERLSV